MFTVRYELNLLYNSSLISSLNKQEFKVEIGRNRRTDADMQLIEGC